VVETGGDDEEVEEVTASASSIKGKVFEFVIMNE